MEIIIKLIGGLAIFLYGMSEMNHSVQRVSGNRLERALANMSSNPLKGIFLGIVITAIVQSSSASTVMVVGFVNSGMLTLNQATSVIIGANVGTTITSWLLSVAGISSDNVFLSLFKPDSLGFLLAIFGVIMLLFVKNRKKKQVGTLLISLGLILIGLTMMSDALSPVAEMPAFKNALTYFSNPFLGFFVGLALTAVIQSSAASIGILQAIAIASTASSSLTIGIVVPLVLGTHIGTCVTAMLSSLGTGVNARRAALIHLYYNIITSVVLLAGFELVTNLFFKDFLEKLVTSPAEIAMIHTVTSLLGALMMLMFSRALTRLAEISVREKVNEDLKYLPDDHFLSSPVVALGQSRQALHRMAEMARDNIFAAMNQIKEYSSAVASEIENREELIDTYEDKLSTFLVKLSESNLGVSESHEAAKFLHIIGDLERISDHAVNIQESAEEITDRKVSFSQVASGELDVMMEALHEMMDITVKSFIEEDYALAGHVEPLEEVIDELKAQILNNHISRVQSGDCSIKNGFILNDILTNFERVSDHCSNISACFLRADRAFDFHEYRSHVKGGQYDDFSGQVHSYEEKYISRL